MQMVLTVYSKWIEGADKSEELSKIDAFLIQNATKMPPKCHQIKKFAVNH